MGSSLKEVMWTDPCHVTDFDILLYQMISDEWNGLMLCVLAKG